MKRIFTFILLIFIAFPNIAYSYSNTYQNTGDYRTDIVGVAKTQIGYTELTGEGGEPVIDSAIPYYTKYGARYGNPTGHWCAFFVLWCAEQAGIPTSIICKSADCGNCGIFVNWFKSNHRWKDNDYSPQTGDIIFFDWDNDMEANHVGIVYAADTDTILTIEGNTGGENGYMVMERARSEYILGYGVPDYGLKNKINGYANMKHTAYMLPDSNSATVWEIWQGDELQVLCRDGDYYLVLYPYVYSGKFVAAYVPVYSVDLQEAVPDAQAYYSINEKAVVNSETIIYHNASCDELMGNVSNKVRATLNPEDEVEVLFEEEDFLFIRTSDLTGYIEKNAAVYMTEYDYTINGMYLKNENNEYVTELARSDAFYAGINFDKHNINNEQVSIIFAAHDEHDNIIAAQHILAEYPQGENHICEVLVELPTESDVAYITAFIWNGFDDMKPLSEKYVCNNI